MTMVRANKLSGLLEATGLFSRDQIQALLAEQKSTGNSITDVAVSMGLVEEEPFLEALAQAMSVPYIKVSDLTIEEDVLDKLANMGKRVIVAGLDQDYRGKPFEPMPQIMAIAEYVTKTLAVCVRCGGRALVLTVVSEDPTAPVPLAGGLARVREAGARSRGAARSCGTSIRWSFDSTW